MFYYWIIRAARWFIGGGKKTSGTESFVLIRSGYYRLRRNRFPIGTGFRYPTLVIIPLLQCNNTSPVNQQSIHFVRLLNKRRSSAEMCFLNQSDQSARCRCDQWRGYSVFSCGSRTPHCLHSDARFNPLRILYSFW